MCLIALCQTEAIGLPSNQDFQTLPRKSQGSQASSTEAAQASVVMQIHPPLTEKCLLAAGSAGATTGGEMVAAEESTAKLAQQPGPVLKPGIQISPSSPEHSSPTAAAATAANAPTTTAPGATVPTTTVPAADSPAAAPTTTTAPATTATPPAKPSSGANPLAPEGEKRRGFDAPYDSVFPGTEFVGSAGTLPIGVPDGDPIYPAEKAIWKACPILKKLRIKIYGWVDPGANASTSRHSNIPLSYAVVPNRLEMDQAVIRLERVPDTVQTEHSDWGFRSSFVYGIDYRYTTAAGWYPASLELLSHNSLYGADPVELYGMWYTPKVAQGMVLKYGRYISPPDIEAQLSPDNYLYTHSVMFTYDNYTQTGILSTVKLSDQWVIQGGVHAGDDMAPWTRGAIPSGEGFIRWTSKRNKDSLYFGVNSFNNGHYRLAQYKGGVQGHDNLGQQNFTWSHKFNDRVHTATEAYYIYQINALQGGTVIDGPPKPVFTNVGPGKFLHGVSTSAGFVNYTNFKITNRDYITVRPIDYLLDPRGERTGFATTYASWTVGWCHRFSDLLCIRPEIRYERSLARHVTPYDDGTRQSQFTISADVIQRF